MLRTLHELGRGLDLDIRELILQRKNTVAAHAATDNEHRPTLQDLINNYHVDKHFSDPPPKKVALFDDVLTTGAHFKAAQTVLQNRYPDVSVVGIFIARCVPYTGDS